MSTPVRRGIPLAPLERILHEAGATRVSAEAVEELRNLLEAFAKEVAKEAVEAAKHAGRKTVRKEDVAYAARNAIKILALKMGGSSG